MRLVRFAALISLLAFGCTRQPETAPSTTTTSTTTSTSGTISTQAPACADAGPGGNTAVQSSAHGSFDQTDQQRETAIARDEDGAWWLLIEGGPPRSMSGISFPPDAFETFAEARSFRIEFVTDLTGDGIDELIIDPGLGNDQRLYPVQLTSCSARTIPTGDGQPFFFEVASGFTYEASYACWSVEDSLGIVTTVARGPRDESGFIDGEVTKTGWRYENGVMQAVDLTAATPVTVVCPGRP